MGRLSIKKALIYATEKHEGQMRVGGAPYITHPIAVKDIVKQWGYGDSYQVAALFHDLLEDTDATEDEILARSNRRVLRAVRLLTKQKGYLMQDYVAGISSDPIARVIKAADRLHNLQCATVTSEEFKRRYVLETVEWYLDLCPEIPAAVRALAHTMQQPPDIILP